MTSQNSLVAEALEAMSEKLTRLPEEIKMLISASVAASTGVDLSQTNIPPAPMPTSMLPESENDDQKPHPGPDVDQNLQQSRGARSDKNFPATSSAQNKSIGTFILRKVSQNVADATGAASRVGGPRNMNNTRLFAGPHAGASVESRNRWKSSTYRRPAEGGGAFNEALRGTSGASAADLAATSRPDPQAPIMEALQDFEKVLSEDQDVGGSGNEHSGVLALGYVFSIISPATQLNKSFNRMIV